jgi:branched-chain amino acid transport system permease protein
MRHREITVHALLIAGLALVPLVVTENRHLNFLVVAFTIAVAAQGWNILGGFGGQFSFGHAAFFGTGAYANSILQVRYGLNAYPALLIAVAAASLAGGVIGYLSFRAGLRGSYFALVTLAFAEVMRILCHAAPFTGGAGGIGIKLDVGLANLQFSSRAAYYWLAVLLVGLSTAIAVAVRGSRFGAQLVALRENEAAARALGIDALAVKMKAIVLSAAMTGAAGAFYGQFWLNLNPDLAFGTWISVEALLAPIVGGLGTVLGPLVGALALHGLGEATKEATKALIGPVAGVDLVVYGVVLILCISFAPRGLVSLMPFHRWPEERA